MVTLHVKDVCFHLLEVVVEISALNFSQCNFFVVVKFSSMNAGTRQTSTCQAETRVAPRRTNLSVFGSTKL